MNLAEHGRNQVEQMGRERQTSLMLAAGKIQMETFSQE